MKFLPTGLPGVILIEPDVFKDARGFFLETFHQRKYAEGGIPGPFVQDNHSYSARGTLRGLHAQGTKPQGKLVRAVEGEMFDVAVDIRRGSPTLGKWVGFVLSGDNFRQLWIPPGFAHGFCVTSERVHVEYKCTDFYDSSDEIAVAWNDPDIGIAWPIAAPSLSEKDARAPRLAGVLDQIMKNEERQRQVEVRDSLTGLYNRRAFDALLSSAIAIEGRRADGTLGLVLLDLDHFKKLNDTFGHVAGDAALRSVARLLGQHLRKGDQAARYGGEEFVVILPGADEVRTRGAAERLRLALQKHRFVFEGARIPLTASLGVAAWPADGREPEALLAVANRALYAAKQGGRNRVETATGTSPPAGA